MLLSVDFVPRRLLGSRPSTEKLVLEVDMRRAVSMLMAALLMYAIGFPNRTAWGGTEDKIEGRWERVSGQGLPAGWKEFKLIAGGHFMFVYYDTGKKKAAITGGGTYKIDGEHYTEHVEFMDVEDAKDFIGKDQLFTVKWEGDNLIVTGTLSNGEKLNVTYKRTE
jgi:hypothetical protein